MVSKKKSNKLAVFFIIIDALFCFGLFILYGPWGGFRNFWITSAMTTLNHHYLAHIFYSDGTINEVLSNNYVVEINEEPDLSLINTKQEEYAGYADRFEKQILEKDEGNDLYKVINVQGSGYRGYLVAIYDPSKVKLVVADNPNRKGEFITTLSEKYNARVAINASGFYDIIESSNPSGTVIKDGKIIHSSIPRDILGGIIGFDYNNKLVLTKGDAQTALEKYNLRDAVEFGPFLVVNGKPSFIQGNGGWGIAPRTVIGQRNDGIVLFLVIDGRRPGHSLGADMVELTKIMINYKAVNAANLDGGLSTALTVEKKLHNKPAILSDKERAIPNAWIVTD